MQQMKPRNPLMAALMSLVLPGFGQLYNGAVNGGLLLFIAFTLCSIPLVALVALYLPAALTLPLLLLSVGVSLGIWIYGVVDAWKAARRQQNDILQNWQLPGVYVLIFLTAVLPISPRMTP
ncbi:MAG: hypothetical protein GY938_12840 [Ketobacter sp.]|nr:hypothetical protein [Ketobacter sp.]